MSALDRTQTDRTAGRNNYAFDVARAATTILVVDDYESLANLLAQALQRAGYHVLTATSGAQAQAVALAAPRVDLLISDIEMPQMRGDELASWMEATHPEAKVIFVSSACDLLRGYQAAAFIPKPFRTDALLAEVHAALNGNGCAPTLTAA